MADYNNNLFVGEFVKLTSKRPGDITTMMEWMEDADYLRNLDSDTALPASLKQLEEEGEPSPKEAYFRLRRINDDHLIGFVTIHSIEWNNRAGTLAIGIGDRESRGKGYGKDALKQILRYAFQEMNLNRIGLDVIEYNQAGIHVYKKMGFIEEGRKRSSVYRDGKYYDIISMGLLKSEWICSNH